jgi:predicted amidohydrolase
VLAAAIRMEPVVGDMAENLRRAELLVNEAAVAGADWMARH